jgi:hypothetical protein
MPLYGGDFMKFADRIRPLSLLSVFFICLAIWLGICEIAQAAAPAGQWWNASYQYRHKISIKAGATNVPTAYSVKFQFDHAALVSASKSLSSGNDIRIVYWNGSSWTELDRRLDDQSAWNSARTQVWFRTQAAINANQSDDNYYMYYGYSSAGSPPTTWSNVFLFYDDFNDGILDTGRWTGSGTYSESGGVLTIGSGGSNVWATATYAIGYDTRWEGRLYISGTVNALNYFGASDAVTYSNAFVHFYWSSTGSAHYTANAVTGTEDRVSYTPTTPTSYHEYSFNREGTTGVRYFQDTTQIRLANDPTYIPTANLRMLLRNGGASQTMTYDWVRVRNYVSPEPTVYVSSETGGPLEPLIAYSQNGSTLNNQIYYSFYQGTDWTAGAYAATDPDVGDWDQHYKVARTNPAFTRQAVVWKNGNGSFRDLMVSIWDGTNWDDGTGSPYGDVRDLGSTVDANYRTFDAAFEQLSGDLLVVSAINNVNLLYYWTWNGSAWSDTGTATIPINNWFYRWCRLAARPDSDEIAFIGSSDGGGVSAARWTGNAWTSTTTCVTTGGNNATDAIDIQYVQAGTYANDIVAVWGQGQYVYRKIYRSNLGSWDASTQVADLGSGNTVKWLKLKAKPRGDDLILAIGGVVSSNYSIYTIPYDGDTRTFGSLSSAHTAIAYGNSDYNRPFDVIWDPAAGADKVLLVFSSTTSLRYTSGTQPTDPAQWPPIWNAQQNISASYQAFWVQLERGANDTVHLAIHDNADDLRTWTWASSTWTAKNTITTDLEIGYNSNREVEVFALSSLPLNIGAFEYRSPITINYSQKGADCPVSGINLPNFPVLISLTDNRFKTNANGGNIYNSNGYDIVFRASDGITHLDHEIERYNGTTGELVAWVRIPSLFQGDANTTIYIYYGNAVITSPTQNPTGVWDSNFKGVWHLKESGNGTAGEFKDSTSNANHGQGGGGTSSRVPTLTASGKIGPAQDFNRANTQFISMPDATSLQITGDLTLEAWVNGDSWLGWMTSVVTRQYGTGTGDSYGLFVGNPDDAYAWFSAGSVSGTADMSTGTWYHLAVSRTATASYIYVNGTQVGSTGATTINTDAQPVIIGGNENDGTTTPDELFDGKIDEVRISNVARDACWIETEYNNQSNLGTFITLGSEEPSLVMTGYYSGNGVDNRAITGVGFKPDIVIIKSSSAVNPVCSTSSMGGYAKELGNTANFVSGLIKSLDADGFTVGTDARVNGSSVNYYWVAFKAGAGELKVSSYPGTGVAQSITGVGFQPDWVVVMSSNNADYARHRSASMTNTAYFDTYANDSTGITALESDGFRVDTNATVNYSGRIYHYFAFKKVSGKMNEGFYTGNNTDNTNITGAGFSPEYVIVKRSAADSGVARPAPLSGDSSLLFTAGINQANHIQALQNGGFQVGTDARVNYSGTYYWMAFGRSALPTAVKLTSFTATEHSGGVLLRWKTGYEVSNLGFHVYREENGSLVRLTPEPVAGSALLAGSRTALTAGHHYHWWDSASLDTRPSTLATQKYWLKDIDLNGTHTMHGPVTPVISREPIPEKFRPELLSEVGLRLQERYRDYWRVQELKEKIRSRGLRNAPAYVKSASAGRSLKERFALGAFHSRRELRSSEPEMVVQRHLASKSAVKILVKEEGWYRVSQPEWVASGLSSKMNPNHLQLYVDGREQPIRVIGGKDGRFDPRDAIEFYGVGLDTPSTDTRVYWLVEGLGPGKRVEISRGQGGQIASSSFLYTVERKDRVFYLPAIRNGEEENWFGPVVSGSGVDQILEVKHLDSASLEEALLEVVIQGFTEGLHRVKVYLNDKEVGEVVFGGQSKGLLQVEVPQALLDEGENLVSLVAQGGEADISVLDTIRLGYWHTYTANDDELKFRAKGGEHLSVSGFSNARVRVIDITEPKDLVEVIGKARSEGGSYSMTFRVPGSGERTLLALTLDRIKVAEGVVLNHPSFWSQGTSRHDLVMISHRDFMEALKPLKKLRESQGLSVALIDIEDLYDEFSFGVKSPKAIKDFLSYTKTKWKRSPRFVLLVGDASLDPRNYLGLGEFDLLPTKLIDTQYLETASDDWFVDFNNDGLPDMAIGRLPVQTVEEAATVVSKIVGYERSGVRREALLVADINEKEDEFNFQGASEGVEALLPSSLMVRKIYRSSLSSDSQTRSMLIGSINEGPLLVNFIGHGSIEIWRGLFSSEDAETLINGMRLPFFISMTCLNGYFQSPFGEPLAEALLKAKQGGAVAVWASSGLTEPDKQVVMNKELIRLLFGRESLTLGEATARAKSSVSDQDIRKTWILFGDPTTRLK